MKKLQGILYTLGAVFYMSALVFGVSLFLYMMAQRLVKSPEEEKIKEVEHAAAEVVDGLEELYLAVELDLKDLEGNHNFKG